LEVCTNIKSFKIVFNSQIITNKQQVTLNWTILNVCV